MAERMTDIHFERVTGAHLDTIFSWLREPEIMAFWDNTEAHKDDIIHFTEGRKTPSTYAGGGYIYWIASLGHEPFAMIMTIEETHKVDLGQEKLSRLSKTGHTYSLDYMIGNPQFFGKGYGSKTLSAFLDFFRKEYDSKADTFLIDPTIDNPRAKHVYMKAGFQHVCDFMMKGDVSGQGKMHHLLIRKFEPTITLLEATSVHYPCIQNMARFYVYDLSRECGSLSSDWAMPKEGLYESIDFKSYFEEPERKAYLIKVYDEIGGFVLLNHKTEDPKNNWNMGEFFIIAKFQRQGIASRVARKVWEMHPGTWEVSVIPQNKLALSFWEKVIHAFTAGDFNQSVKDITYDEDCPRRIIFSFETQKTVLQEERSQITIRSSELSDIERMASLSKAKRLSYEKVQPQFWRHAGDIGDFAQKEWFQDLLGRDDYLMFTAENENQEMLGFAIGRLMSAPDVYNPGGLTLMIDDFCVKSDSLWQPIGGMLIEAMKASAKTKEGAQILVVCGAHDHAKRGFLREQNLSIASEWFVGSIA